MSDKSFVTIIVAVVIAHFIFAVGFLIYKIYSTPKSNDEPDSNDNENQKE
jgi:hypothetical protein